MLTSRQIREIVMFDRAARVMVKSGRAPSRKCLRYNYIIPKRGRDPRTREVEIVHVAVRLSRNYRPIVKDVARFCPGDKVIRVRDMGYHMLAGWVVYWDRKDYEAKSPRAYIPPQGHDKWMEVDYHFNGAATFPWHATVNPSALAGTRYQYCRYRDGFAIGLMSWLSLYRVEPAVETLAKMGLHNLITPVATTALHDKRVFRFVQQNVEEVKKHRVKSVLWSARHGCTLAEADRHFEIVDKICRMRAYSIPRSVRFDYDRLAKLLGKWGVDELEYFRYVELALRVGLDPKNDGTLYPPVSGGRVAFMARLERMEADWAREQRRQERAAARRRIAREKAEQEEWERTQMALMRERTKEIAAFQRSIDRFKRLNLGDGVTCVLAKSQDELRAEGRRMCNCVGCGTYGRGIVLGNTLILMIRRNGKPFVDVEIDRRTWTVRQCYAKRNTAAPEEISRAADEIAQILKRQHQKMRKGKAA